MIAFLRGKLLEKSANTVVVDVGGVGYEVSVPLTTFYELGEPGADVALKIHTIVREDAISLYGFMTSHEREIFTLLISVSGIGPKSAISALSGMGANEMIGAIRDNNIARLTAIPGVGKKTAERLVVELKDKVRSIGGDESAGPKSDENGDPIPSSGAIDDAVSALVNLGYQRQAADKAVSKAAQEGTELEVQKLLRRALQLLAKG
jgi:Holliday junction DNA helicase RuvA